MMSDQRKRPEDRDLWMRYLGALSVLGDAAAHINPNSMDGADCRERIERCMEDAQANYPIRCRQTLLRYDIEPEMEDV